MTSMPRYRVRTYGRPGPQDSAAQTFDLLVQDKPVNIADGDWPSTEVDSRKRKVDVIDGALSPDPFLFDSDEDGSPRKQATEETKPATQPKKIMITTVRKNPLKAVANNTGKVTNVGSDTGTSQAQNKALIVKTTTVTAPEKTSTVKPAAKQVTKDNVVITRSVTAPETQTCLKTYASVGTKKNSKSSTLCNKFCSSKLDHSYSNSLDTTINSHQLSTVTECALGSQDSGLSQNSIISQGYRLTAKSGEASSSQSVQTSQCSSKLSEYPKKSNNDIQFESDEAVESCDPEIMLNSPTNYPHGQVISSPPSSNSSPITISDDDSLSVSSKNGTETKTYSTQRLGATVFKSNDGRKSLLMGKSLSLDGRITKPPSLESKLISRLHSAKSLPLTGAHSTKHALAMDSSKPVFIGYAQKSKADDEGKEPVTKRLLSGSKKVSYMLLAKKVYITELNYFVNKFIANDNSHLYHYLLLSFSSLRQSITQGSGTAIRSVTSFLL